jgi:hypothetical protein
MSQGSNTHNAHKTKSAMTFISSLAAVLLVATGASNTMNTTSVNSENAAAASFTTNVPAFLEASGLQLGVKDVEKYLRQVKLRRKKELKGMSRPEQRAFASNQIEQRLENARQQRQLSQLGERVEQILQNQETATIQGSYTNQPAPKIMDANGINTDLKLGPLENPEAPKSESAVMQIDSSIIDPSTTTGLTTDGQEQQKIRQEQELQQQQQELEQLQQLHHAIQGLQREKLAEDFELLMKEDLKGPKKTGIRKKKSKFQEEQKKKQEASKPVETGDFGLVDFDFDMLDEAQLKNEICNFDYDTMKLAIKEGLGEVLGQLCTNFGNFNLPSLPGKGFFGKFFSSGKN